MTQMKSITRDDVLSMDDYGKIRKSRRAEVVARKKHRRVAVGPDAMFYFENYDTMWLQIHEMLYIEKGGEEQIADELDAYNPLIPQGKELVATLMFEIDDEARRKQVLGSLGGVEETITITIGDAVVNGRAEDDVDRTTADGKASSVQFLHFRFTPDQIAAFKAPDSKIILGINHPAYTHMAGLTEDTRAALAGDFD